MAPSAMDSGEVSDWGGGDGERERRASRIMARCCFSVVFIASCSLLFSLLVGFVALAIGSPSGSPPVSISTSCRIISSGVDIRSSKVCELGPLNYRAKNVLYPSGRTRFRCRYDYYWASIFEVEYKEYFSGHLRHAIAEAPKEALPLDCRPSFSTAWLTRMKFKINETYSCRYSLGSGKADIYPDDFFNCQSKDPSPLETIRRFFVLFIKLNFSFYKKTSKSEMAYLITGLVAGMLFGMCSIILVKSLRILCLTLMRYWEDKKLQIEVFAMRCRRACILVAYISSVGWLALQFGKMVGLKELFFGSHLEERSI